MNKSGGELHDNLSLILSQLSSTLSYCVHAWFTHLQPTNDIFFGGRKKYCLGTRLFSGKPIWESDNGSGTKSKMSGDGGSQDIAAVMGFSGFGEDRAGRAELAYDSLYMS